MRVGQKVKNIETGEIDTVVSFPGMEEYDRVPFINAEKGFVLEKHMWCLQENWKTISAGRPKKESTPEFVVFKGSSYELVSSKKELQKVIRDYIENGFSLKETKVFKLDRQLKVSYKVQIRKAKNDR